MLGRCNKHVRELLWKDRENCASERIVTFFNTFSLHSFVEKSKSVRERVSTVSHHVLL